jgi:hypothetical protein
MLLALASGLGWQVPRACSGARAASCRTRSIGLQLPTERTGDTFLAVIDLGEGDGTVTHEFRPYFSSSALITMRYPVPHTLEAEPIQGVIKVTKAGDGLFEGDVRHPHCSHHRPHTAALTPPSSHRRLHAAALTRCDLRPQVLRAFSTLEMRYDSGAKEVRFGDGILGEEPADSEQRRASSNAGAADEASRTPAAQLRSLVADPRRLGQLSGELGGAVARAINPEEKPRRCLYVSEGQPYQQARQIVS